jgi:hypothetical protein
MKADATTPRTRFTVDLSDYPDLVAIYLGLRVNSIRGLLPALEFGPKLEQAVRDNPPGLLRHEFLVYSLHLGIRHQLLRLIFPSGSFLQNLVLEALQRGREDRFSNRSKQR